jgi:hypothetical protein
LTRQHGILNISQPYRPPWPLTGIALLFLLLSIISRVLGGMAHGNSDTVSPHFLIPFCIVKIIQCPLPHQLQQSAETMMEMPFDALPVAVDVHLHVNIAYEVAKCTYHCTAQNQLLIIV